jgi:hypothetical protein
MAPDCPLCAASGYQVERLKPAVANGTTPVLEFFCDACGWGFALNDQGSPEYRFPTQRIRPKVKNYRPVTMARL